MCLCQHSAGANVFNGVTISVWMQISSFLQVINPCMVILLYLVSLVCTAHRIETVNLKSNNGAAKILGSVICLGGALILTLYKGTPLFNHPHPHAHAHAMAPTVAKAIELSSSRRAERWTIGCLALIAGTLLWSSWFIIQSVLGRRYPCQYSSTAIMSFFGAIQSAILSLSTSRDLSMWVLKGKVEIITVIYAVSLLFLQLVLQNSLDASRTLHRAPPNGLGG